MDKNIEMILNNLKFKPTGENRYLLCNLGLIFLDKIEEN